MIQDITRKANIAEVQARSVETKRRLHIMGGARIGLVGSEGCSLVECWEAIAQVSNGVTDSADVLSEDASLQYGPEGHRVESSE